MKKFIIFLIFIFIISCGRWKTTKLKPDLFCTIIPGESTGKIMLQYDKDDILDISFKIRVNRNNIYLIDNILKRVQVLSKNCEPLIYIGDKKPDEEDPSVKYSKFQFHLINAVAVDSSGNIYLQNRFSSGSKNMIDMQGKDFGFSPSYILVFDDKGTLLYTLGRTGAPDISPFNSVEELEIDNNDRLYVMTRSYDMWSVYRFVNKKRDLNINFSENDFKEKDGSEVYKGKIEKIICYKNSEVLLISVAYYNGADFKYRKIFSYSIQKEKVLHSAFVIPDPKNELFALVDDKYIYLWDVDEDNLRFMICGMNGDIINNIAIKFPEVNDSYNEIFLDATGRFYSYHTFKKGVEVREWR